MDERALHSTRSEEGWSPSNNTLQQRRHNDMVKLQLKKKNLQKEYKIVEKRLEKRGQSSALRKGANRALEVASSPTARRKDQLLNRNQCASLSGLSNVSPAIRSFSVDLELGGTVQSMSSPTGARSIPKAGPLRSDVRERTRAREMKAKANRLQKACTSPQKSKNKLKGGPDDVEVELLFSPFADAYSGGSIPCILCHDVGGVSLKWTRPIEELDYEVFLPLFLEGLREKEFPFTFVAQQGVDDLLSEVHDVPEHILPIVPQLMAPLRRGLRTKDHDTVIKTLTVLQRLLGLGPDVGESLQPYYKQVLQCLNQLQSKSWTEEKRKSKLPRPPDMTSIILETIQKMEKAGGKGSYELIKSMIPTYEKLEDSARINTVDSTEGGVTRRVVQLEL